jgi:hypothetical protein
MVLERPRRQDKRSRASMLWVGLNVFEHSQGDFDVSIVLYVNLGYWVLIKGLSGLSQSILEI